jgi:diguanylate cyclase (GGDEF)-like protein/putative nucleotidyltransferase with HDIG domain
MSRLPANALRFLLLIYGVGLACVLTVCLFPVFHAPLVPWEMALFSLLAVLAGGKKVLVIPNKAPENGVALSWDFALTVAATLRFGPAAGVLMACIGSLASCLYPRRQPVYQIAFNLALAATETWAAGLVFLWLNGDTLTLRPVHTIPAMLAFCFISYLINSGGVAGIVALCTGQKAGELWRETFLWAFPSNLAGASASTLAFWVFRADFGLALLLIAPVIYLISQWYTVYTARMHEHERYAEEKQKHIEALEVSQTNLSDLYLATIQSLALAIDAKDQYTHQHILRVQRYAEATALKMGLTGDALEGLKTGALLHDIGKLGIPEYVLLKPGRLTEEEFAKVKKHPEIGAAILAPVDFPWPVLPVVKSHHEKWDGTGYPEGLKGENIPLTARILAVGDVYDALTSSRSYRVAWSHERAVAEIRRSSGSHFDPQVVEAFLDIVDAVAAEVIPEEQLRFASPPPVPATATTRANEARRDIQRAASELGALYEVAQTLSDSLGVDETLGILARKLVALLPGTACLFLLQDEEGASLRVRAAAGVNQDFFAAAHTASTDSRSWEAAQDRRSYRGAYDGRDLLLGGAPGVDWEPLEAALIVPIVHGDDVLGTLNLYDRQPGVFGAHEQRLLEKIAERAASALGNILLFDRTRSDAVTDSLTGLYNARYMTKTVEERCLRRRDRQRRNDPFSLLYLDLDSFKPINDNFGHQKGDQVLQDLALLFQSLVRENDVVARYGGDEFVILVGGGPEEAKAMTRRLQDAVRQYDPGLHHPRLGSLRLGVSIGYGCFPQDGWGWATLVAAADRRMYEDKLESKLGALVGKEESTEPSPATPSPLIAPH